MRKKLLALFLALVAAAATGAGRSEAAAHCPPKTVLIQCPSGILCCPIFAHCVCLPPPG